MGSFSNVEDILQSIIDGRTYTDVPQSRVEDLLIKVSKKISGGSSGGGGGSGFDIYPDDELTTADVNNIMKVIGTDND